MSKLLLTSVFLQSSKWFQNLVLILAFAIISTNVFSQPYAIGHTTKVFTDASRNRNVATEIYYPALTNGDNATIASGSFPVLVFGHGFLMTYTAYKNFWEELVPEGYILCFPKTEGGILPNHGNFGNDLNFLASAMQAENNDASSLLFNAVAAKTALMGHSMGGGASFLGAANNPDINALVNFAAAETNPSAINAAANVTVPTLIFSGSDDCVTPEASNQDLMYANLISACKTQVSIVNGGHCYYADSNFNCSLGESFCNSSLNIDRSQQQSITFSFLKLWLQDKLYDSPTAQIDFNNLLENSTQINYNQSCETLHVDELESGDRITMFPNPVQTTLSLRMVDKNLGGFLTIFNSLSQKVLETKIFNKNTNVDVSHFQVGFYFYTYSKEYFSDSGKFIKIGAN